MLLLGGATDSSARYWVGGTGVWNSTNIYNWSYYSGGPGGAPVPNFENNVYIDANSDTGLNFEISVSGEVKCKSLNIFPDKKLTLTRVLNSGIISIYGNLEISSNTSVIDLITRPPDFDFYGPPTGEVVIWTGSQFIIGTYEGEIFTSSDGITWTSGDLHSTGWGSNSVVYSIVWTGSQFVAVGEDGKVATSPDGITWTNQTGLSSTAWGLSDVNDIVWTGSQFVAVGSAGKVATSSDGVNWTNQTGLSSTAWGTSTVNSIVWTGSQFVAVGASGKVATSPDGITWTNQTGLSSTAWGTFWGVHDIVWTGSQLLAVGASGRVATSNNGVTWTNQTGLSSTAWSTVTVWSVVWTGTQYVAVGDLAKVATSSNGITWTNQTGLSSTAWGTNSISSIVWAGSQFIAVGGYDGKLVKSTDGITWTLSDFSTRNRTINFNGNYFSNRIDIDGGITDLLSDIVLRMDEAEYNGYLSLSTNNTLNTNNYNIYVDYLYIGSGCTLNLGTSNIYTSGLEISSGTFNDINANWWIDNFGYYMYIYASDQHLSNLHVYPAYQKGTNMYGQIANVTNYYFHAPDTPGNLVVSVDEENCTYTNMIFVNTAINRRILLWGEFVPSNITTNSVTGLSDVDFSQITILGPAAPISGTRIRKLPGLFVSALDNTSGITASTFTPKTVYWSKPEGGSFWDNAWASTSGGVPSLTNFPFDEDTVIIDDAGLNENSTIFIDSIYGDDLSFPNGHTSIHIKNFDAYSCTKKFTLDAFHVTGNLSTAPTFTVSNNIKFPAQENIMLIPQSAYVGATLYSSTGGEINIFGYPEETFVIKSISTNTSLNNSIGLVSLFLQGPSTFNTNNYNISTSAALDISNNNSNVGPVTFLGGTSLISVGRFNVSNTPSLDLVNSTLIIKNYFSSVAFEILFSAPITANPIIVKNLKLSLRNIGTRHYLQNIEPKSLEIVSDSTNGGIFLDHIIEFRVRGDIQHNWTFDKFIVDTATSPNFLTLAAKNSTINITYTGRNSAIVNRVNINGIRGYPANTWYAINSTGNDYGWIFNSPPLLTAVDSDNILTAGQSNVALTGTNLSGIDGIQLRQGNAILNATNYSAGASPTFTLPDLSSIFSSGIKFGSVQLDIMENI